MKIRCWGARGSIPVSGPQYVKYGGDTTCMEIRSKDDSILIVDAGSGMRRLGNALVKEGRLDCTLLFTHVHWDHLLGFPYFKPIYNPEADITVYSCPLKQGNMKTVLAKTMEPPYYPVPFNEIKARFHYQKTCALDDHITIGGLDVLTMPISHPNLGLGYKFVEEGKSFVFLTDNELGYLHKGGNTLEEYAEFCRGADLLIHDAEYRDEEYKHTLGWGHSTYKDALKLAVAAGVKKFGLFHHNQDRHDDELDEMIAKLQRITRDQGFDVECFGVSQDMAITL